jgi:hypothetical protein
VDGRLDPGAGNTRPYAEFNALVDPEAAEIVFSSGKPLTMVGLNLTHQAQASPEVVDRLRASATPPPTATVGWLSFFADTYRTVYGFAGPPVHDACAVALLIDPSLVRSVETFVAIETEGRWTRGGDGRRPARPPGDGAQRSRRRWSSTSTASGTWSRSDRRRCDRRSSARSTSTWWSPSSATRPGRDRRRGRLPAAAGRQGRQPAVAAARLGATVAMVGRVGADAQGAWLRQGPVDRGRRRSSTSARIARPLRASR